MKFSPIAAAFVSTVAVIIDAGATPEDVASVVGLGRRRTLVAKKRGSDRDEHGCITSAGYSWCASLDKCIRPFDTDCSNTLPVTTSPVPPPTPAPVNQEFNGIISLIAVDDGQPSCSWNDLYVASTIGLGILGVIAWAVAPAVAAVATAEAGFNFIITAFQTRTCTPNDAKKIWVSDVEIIGDVINENKYEGDLKKYDDFLESVTRVKKKDPNYFQSCTVGALDNRINKYLLSIIDNCNSYVSNPFNLHVAVVAAQFCGQVYVRLAHMYLLKLSKQDDRSSDCTGTLNEAQLTVEHGIKYLEAAHQFFYANATYEAPIATMSCEWVTRYFYGIYPFPPRMSLHCDGAPPGGMPYCDGVVCKSTPRNYMVPYFSADAYPGAAQLSSPPEPFDEYARWKFKQGARLQRDRWWWGDGNKTIGAAYSYNVLADMNSDWLQGQVDNPQDSFTAVFGKLCGANLNATGQQQQLCSLSPNVSCNDSGRDIAAAPGSSATDCCNGCNQVPGCTAFTHDQFNIKGEREGTCYFKSSCNSKVPNSNAVSGVLGGTIPTLNEPEIACNGKVVPSCGECLRPDLPLPDLVNYTSFDLTGKPKRLAVYLEEGSKRAASKCNFAVWRDGPFSGRYACEYESGVDDTVPRCVRRGYCDKSDPRCLE